MYIKCYWLYNRKIARKLPWILDLPSGLMTRVLTSLGVLCKEKQQAIAAELMRPKVSLFFLSLQPDLATKLPTLILFNRVTGSLKQCQQNIFIGVNWIGQKHIYGNFYRVFCNMIPTKLQNPRCTIRNISLNLKSRLLQKPQTQPKLDNAYKIISECIPLSLLRKINHQG